MTSPKDDLFDVAGTVVAITGAAGVIYGAIAKGLAARGAKVALLDLLADKAQEVADEIKAAGGDAIGVACNVLDTDSISAALDTIIKTYGRVDVLINGAGGNRAGAVVPRDGVFTDLSLDEVDKVFALNYKGTFLPTQIFCKHFAKQGKGVVVNTSSMCSIAPLTNVPGYSNAKAAVTNFTQWLAVQVKVDYAEADIRVNEIAPGFLDTTQNHRLLYEEDDITLTPRGRSIISNTPLGRFGDPEELLGPIILLISEAGRFLQGITIPIDGGFAVYSGVGPLDEKR
ncbi:MAG: SDR family NAD(P)-dependent oxidoreductase [Armatimonadetes bacterium]|nr:SDR family NAD(P)-dependent oxidoreductase [Armatimonadota bacterium]